MAIKFECSVNNLMRVANKIIIIYQQQNEQEDKRNFLGH